MEAKNMIGGIVSLAVVVICVAAIMMPVLSDATNVEDTFTNEGYYRLTEIADDDVTIEWDHTDPDQITVNDVVIDLSNVPTERITTIAICEGMLVRYAPVAAGTYVQTYSANGYLGADTTGGTDITITFTNGTVTATVGANTVSASYTNGYYAAIDGEWAMKYSGESAYVLKSESIIVLAGNTVVGTANIGVYGEGTITEGLDLTTVQTDSTEVTATYGDVEFTYTTMDKYTDLVQLTQCDFTITVDETTVDATYTYFMVPYQVTAELAQHLDTAEIALLNAIPVLVIVALVIAALGIAITSRRD